MRTIEHKNIPSRGTGLNPGSINLNITICDYNEEKKMMMNKKIPYPFFNTGCPQGIPRKKFKCPPKLRFDWHISMRYTVVCRSKYVIGRFQKISIPTDGRLPYFNPPLPSEIPKCITPPCPRNSIIVNPPSRSDFPFFAKPFGITSRVHKYVQFRVFYAKLFQMTPLLLQRESL